MKNSAGSSEKLSSGNLWSIVLAGGEGERVRPFVQRWLGRNRPKQYCSFVGKRSMFQHTVDRATQLTPSERTVAVIAREHRQEAFGQLERRSIGAVLLQPRNLDTAAGVFLPLSYVRAHDPKATVVIYPSDHFVYPESRLLDVVSGAVRAAERLRDRMVLLGVPPDRLELEYGWIEPGRYLTICGQRPVREVRAFLEKPSAAEADDALSSGALWNTLVLAAKVDALWQAGKRCFPDIVAHMERLQQAIDTADEAGVLDDIYREMPPKNFSSDLLQQLPGQAAVIELDNVMWSDWGRPERITETLQRVGKEPAFPLACLERPFKPIPMAG